ncbi:GNAT family N-acetyltransferase [Bacillus sp. SM2101]|uniref:GNAT family N-acetyltransferase n=1 Tax=Bacillus sp. SM2101 TaxID=2805366 RepID=UPI001BDF1A47
MIKKLDIRNSLIATELLNVQLVSYEVEAKIIDYKNLPPLNDTTEAIMSCGEEFYGYYVNERLAGAISFKLYDNMLDIHRLFVHPDFFRAGVGRALVQYTLNNYQNVDKYIVRTGKMNTPAKNLYSKLGFVEIKDEQVAPNLFITVFEKLFSH